MCSKSMGYGENVNRHIPENNKAHEAGGAANAGLAGDLRFDRLDHENPTKSLGKKQSPQARWKAKNPLATWAHASLRSGLKRGLIERQPCEKCGAVHGQNGVIIDAHHHDHEKPLAVRWLCRAHHKEAHRGSGVTPDAEA